MMRRWFKMEYNSGFGIAEAEAICRKMIANEKIGARGRSEFWSKLGACLLARANSSVLINRETTLDHLRQSIACYLEGLYVGRSVRDFDTNLSLIWLERPLSMFMSMLREDVEQIFILFESLLDNKHDVDEDGIEVVFRFLSRSPVPAKPRIRRQLKGLCSRTTTKIVRQIKPLSDYPGFKLMVDSLEELRVKLESLDQSTPREGKSMASPS